MPTLKSLLLFSAFSSASLLAACATSGAQVPSLTASQSMPHFPSDLTPSGVAAADDHLALEKVDGTEALTFVADENKASLAALTGDPRYEPFRQRAFAILSATDRIPAPSFLGTGIGNFWQDAQNPKGIWRRTSTESYGSSAPVWEVLLDIDALSKAEGRNWVFKGANCLSPDDTRCLIALSDGGKDAVTLREFDTVSKSFVTDGFVLNEGKHRVEWLNKDTLLVATNFGDATLTESGYPFVIKSLKRGQPLTEAKELFRGNAADGGYGVSPDVLLDGSGKVLAVLAHRPLDTFREEVWDIGGNAPVKLNLPERISVYGAQGSRLIFKIEENWGRYSAGSLLSADLKRLDAPSVIFAPTARQSVEDVAVMETRIVAALYDNVRARITVFAPEGEKWTSRPLPVPENSAAHLGSRSRATDQLFFTYEGFLTPATLSIADVSQASTRTIRQNPARFDASTHVVEQFEATSSDGVKIPYFLVRPKTMKPNGTTPTIVYGYGGFQVSKPAAYIPEMGKLWLENGGAYVIANIRGGGEFGPAWHQAALKHNRQIAFDDFAAVARDLNTRGVASPKKIGIYGRSNGGVLTSVTVTQHPELINAAVIESPLIDMLRYQDLPPGASWIGEYGDPRIAEDAAYIATYSAYQRLSPDVKYPRVYITTNTRDDRVHPGHARKFAARLKDQGHEHLYYEDTAGGHSNDADPVANARRWARHYVYLSQQLMN